MNGKFIFLYLVTYFSKTTEPTVNELVRALQAEQRRSAALEAQLKSSKRGPVPPSGWVEEPSDVHLDFMPPHSTMREDSRGFNESSLMMTMSFASLQISECKPMMGAQDVDKKTFEQWKEKFEAGLMFAGVSNEMMKFNAFKMKAGYKLLELLNLTFSGGTTADEELCPYSNAIQRLDNYYRSREYTLLQRQKLRSTTQLRGEEDMDYVKRVVGIVRLCGYPEAQELEMVTDVIQSSAVNSKVRELARKFSRKGGVMAVFMNKVEACINDMRSEENYAKTHQIAAEVSAVSYDRRAASEFRSSGYNRGHPSQRRGAYRYQEGSSSYSRGPSGNLHGEAANWNAARGRGTARGSYDHPGTARDDGHSGTARDDGHSGTARDEGRRPVPCWRCTGNYHSPERCFNATKTCRRCGVMGHIERACRPALSIQSAIQAKRYYADEDGGPPPQKPRKVSAIMAAKDPDEANMQVPEQSVSVSPKKAI